LDEWVVAIIEINPLRYRLLINTELFGSLIGVEAEAASNVDVNATQHLRRLITHQLIVDDFPRTLKALFVTDQRPRSDCNRWKCEQSCRQKAICTAAGRAEEEKISYSAYRRCSVTRREGRPIWNLGATGAFTGAAWFGIGVSITLHV
jgi:hypothetical protein